MFEIVEGKQSNSIRSMGGQWWSKSPSCTAIKVGISGARLVIG